MSRSLISKRRQTEGGEEPAYPSALRRVMQRLQRKRKHPEIKQVADAWEMLAGRMLLLGGASEGNSVETFTDGDDLIESMWADIDTATERVWVETYILQMDRVGSRTVERLTAAAQRGCDVTLMYDALGSPRMPAAEVLKLRDAGVKVVPFNPPRLLGKGHPWWRRNHRKITIIDGDIAYCGGMNISEDYAGARHGNSLFWDCHLRLRGPCVRMLAAVHANSLKAAKQPPVRLPASSSQQGHTFVQVLASRGYVGRQAIQRAMRLATRMASREVLLVSPYFVPPTRLMRAIKRAAKSGVDVQVITAGRSDVPVSRMASRHIYGELLEHGVRVFELLDRTLHAKVTVVDGVYSAVGSFNLDVWSHKRNLEVMVNMFDVDQAAILEKFVAELRSNAQEVTMREWKKRPWWQRFSDWLVYRLLSL